MTLEQIDNAGPTSTSTSSASATGEIYEQKDEAYFSYYSMLSHQAQMLQDTVRTTAYQRAILNNAATDFQNKVVMDVGAGNGILSFFAAQAGASKVFAVEASNMVECLRKVVDASKQSRSSEEVAREKEALDLMGASSGEGAALLGGTNPNEARNAWLQNRLVPVHSKVEDVTPQMLENHTQVDTIVSECLGVLLVHERMCESFLDARDRFLAPGGSVFPSAGTICLAPFEDKQLWTDTSNKAKWWLNSSFYGVDTSPFASLAFGENFSSPVVGVFPAQCLLSVSCDYVIDFSSITKEELKDFTVPVEWRVGGAAIVHGLGGWFDLHFNSQSTVSPGSTPVSGDTDTAMGEASSASTANAMSLEAALNTIQAASSNASTSATTATTTKGLISVLETLPTISATTEAANAPTGGANFMTTSPYAEPTHWQQVRFLFPEPLAVNRGQKIVGSVHCKVNDQRSYTMTANLKLVNPDGSDAGGQREAVWRLDRQTYSWS
ncbi:related to HMT1 - hnRNP arginine N-methyltransferase [Melanopsichium pennsylvanicum]|uniref:type I protein arginine methyltransferase n=2 Tax=Melanopsichium pennsylvanicum TaxID=63383 RepID=A0AAJ5C372_9BASI|nr:related to HMT1-hnRNP arginine N-methyltransferase [Melanopsichium pennsylvanicum 4]SNX82243.1 related to HMT1 - hnRNP arginine N-methyltransferase [Melanopsichium pennsylvanicum]